MNVKNFFVGGIVGGIANFLLGWLIYGILLKEVFPSTGTENYLFIFLGCLSFGFLLSFVFSQAEGINKCVAGIKAAMVIGFLIALYTNFFMNVSSTTIDYKLIAIDTLVTTVMSGIVGAVIAVTNGKMS